MAWREDANPRQRAVGELVDALNACLDAADDLERAGVAVERRAAEALLATARQSESARAAEAARSAVAALIGEAGAEDALASMRRAREAQNLAASFTSAAARALDAAFDPVGAGTAPAAGAAHDASVMTTSNTGA